jgi:hypothetical protein
MNISHKELQQIFEAFSESDAGALREKCPSLEDLIRSIETKYPSKKRGFISDHVSNCPYCAKDIKWFLKIRLESEKLGSAVDGLARKNRKYFLGFGIPANHAAASFIGFIALSISFWTLIGGALFSYLPKERERTDQIQLWRSFEPVGKIEKKFDLRFHWEFFGQADFFVLELFDDSLAPLWKSPHLFEKSVQLPRDIFDKVYPRKQYFWIVLAHDREGRKSESDLIQFEIYNYQ